MAKRVLKQAAKSASSKGKAEASYEDAVDHAPSAVRETAVPYGSSVPATQAKNRFGEIVQMARESGPVFIERHGQAQAVVLGIDAYNKLISNERTSQERELDFWTREFNALHASMQTQEARQAVDALFSATDAQLNRRDT